MRYLRINVYGFFENLSFEKLCGCCLLARNVRGNGHQMDASLECKIFSLFLDKWEKAEISICSSCVIAASSAITA